MFHDGWNLRGDAGLEPERRIAPEVLFDLVKPAFGVADGAGVLVALGAACQRKGIDGPGAPGEGTCLRAKRFTAPASRFEVGKLRRRPGGRLRLLPQRGAGPDAECGVSGREP